MRIRFLLRRDNPRSEALSQIFDDMREGLEDLSSAIFIEDRKRAISAALDSAKSGDCILIAGKGHETFQEFDGTVIPFDDRSVARELLALKSFNVGEGLVVSFDPSELAEWTGGRWLDGVRSADHGLFF